MDEQAIPLHYRLDEQGNPVPEFDLLTWAKWMEHSYPARRVDQMVFRAGTPGEIEVSTVFLGTAHPDWRHLLEDTPVSYDMLYQTMVFAEEPILARLLELAETDDRSIIAQAFGLIDIQKRYATKEQAKAGHKNMCHFIETCLAQGLLPDGEKAHV